MSQALQVLYVDNHVLAVAKPAGQPCVPDSSGDASLFERARAWIESTYKKPGRAFLGVVHRLDRPVSGVVVFARTSKGAARLTRAFAERQVAKLYWGLSAAPAGAQSGELIQQLWKDSARNRVLVVDAEREGSKEAVTAWRVAETEGDRALYELLPATGRSHQLRVAMATLGRPLLGDLRYGPGPPLLDRSIGLHARALLIPHPTRDFWLLLGAAPPALEVWRFAACRGARSGSLELAGERPTAALDELLPGLERVE
ncbi:MAG: 23S rRNA pseudouridine1911/1915/1917 synthase [Planctomycetota bacterium]